MVEAKIWGLKSNPVWFLSPTSNLSLTLESIANWRSRGPMYRTFFLVPYPCSQKTRFHLVRYKILTRQFYSDALCRYSHYAGMSAILLSNYRVMHKCIREEGRSFFFCHMLYCTLLYGTCSSFQLHFLIWCHESIIQFFFAKVMWKLKILRSADMSF